jgi:hypothetical protein
MEKKEIESEVSVQLQSNGQVPTIYVEGISQFALGFPNSRLLFHSLATKTNNPVIKEEVHHLAVELVTPTSSLIEMIKLLSTQISSNENQIKDFGDEWLKKINDSISDLSKKQSAQSSAENEPSKKRKISGKK